MPIFLRREWVFGDLAMAAREKGVKSLVRMKGQVDMDRVTASSEAMRGGDVIDLL